MTRTDHDLHWRVEEACLNAWPCTRQLLWAPWLLRLQGGTTRRINSLNPLRAERYDVDAILRPAAELFAHRQRPLTVRVPSIAPGLDRSLDRYRYTRAGETCTLYAARPLTARSEPALSLSPAPDADWLAVRQKVNPADETQTRIFAAVVDAIVAPKTFATLRYSGQPVSIAYGAIHDGLLVIESVATDPVYRGRGFGRRAVAGLLGWGGARGAAPACLQVLADNPAAHALYRSLGFDRELYRYHYRQPPATPTPSR